MKNFLLLLAIAFSFTLSAQLVSKGPVVERDFHWNAGVPGTRGFTPLEILSVRSDFAVLATGTRLTFSSSRDRNFELGSAESKQGEFEESSSGGSSLIGLDSNLNVLWEQVLVNEYVLHLAKFNDSTFLASGNSSGREYAWLALFDWQGKLIWKEKYKYKQSINVEGLLVDGNAIYLLHKSQSLRFYRYRPQTVKKHFFFETEDNERLYLIKLDNGGQLLWRKPIDKRKNIHVYGTQLLLGDDKLYLNYTHIGPETDPETQSMVGKDVLVSLNKKGNILKRQNFPNRRCIGFSNGVLSCTAEGNDSLQIFCDSLLLQTVAVPNQVKRYWIQGGARLSTGTLLYGSHRHNLGFLLMYLNSEMELDWFWTKKGDTDVSQTTYSVLNGNQLLLAGETSYGVYVCRFDLKQISQ